MLTRIQDRVALMTRLPVIHQEDMQVLRYGMEQYYHKHTDSLPGDAAGPRVATLLIYLADAEEGGEVRRNGGRVIWWAINKVHKYLYNT